MRKFSTETWSDTRWLTYLTVSLLMLLTIFHTPPAHADAYLDALQSEADGLSVDPETSAAKTTTKEVVDNKDLKRDAFERMLDKNYHGTYIFYRRLQEENRALVYQAYTKSPDVEPLRQMIIDLLVN